MLKSDLKVKLIKKQTCGEKFKLAFCSKRQKRKINELSLENQSDTDEEDQLDDLKYKLDHYLMKEVEARKNWQRLKLRIMVVQKFSSLQNFKKKLEVELEDSDPEEPIHPDSQK